MAATTLTSLSLSLSQLGKVDLAHHIISRDPMISRDKQLEKKLWLRIAEHVIKKERDIRKLVPLSFHHLISQSLSLSLPLSLQGNAVPQGVWWCVKD